MSLAKRLEELIRDEAEFTTILTDIQGEDSISPASAEVFARQLRKLILQDDLLDYIAKNFKQDMDSGVKDPTHLVGDALSNLLTQAGGGSKRRRRRKSNKRKQSKKRKLSKKNKTKRRRRSLSRAS